MNTQGSDAAGPAAELSILIPCLNEAETITACISKAKGFLERSRIVGEVIVADNGSDDGSVALAKTAGARVVEVSQRGYGAALRGGIAVAKGRYIVMGDADDSYDFSTLDAFVEHLRDGAALVMGNRFAGGIQDGAMPKLNRYLGNPLLSFVGRVLFGVKVRDFHCGMRAFDTESIRALGLRTSGMEFASEMVVRCALASYRIDEVPTTLSPDGRSRRPHLRPWRDGWRHLRFLLIYSPRWLFLYPGAFLTGLGILVMALLFPEPLHLGTVELANNTFLAGCFAFLIGMQTIAFGLLARRIGWKMGLLPEQPVLSTFGALFTLERVLLVAAALFAVGSAGAIWSLVEWSALGFGSIDWPLLPRIFALSLTVLFAGILLFFTSFLDGVVNAVTG